jgi:hypothetical protein
VIPALKKEVRLEEVNALLPSQKCREPGEMHPAGSPVRALGSSIIRPALLLPFSKPLNPYLALKALPGRVRLRGAAWMLRRAPTSTSPCEKHLLPSSGLEALPSVVLTIAHSFYMWGLTVY